MINSVIQEFLKNTLPTLKIAVIGDIMVDRYVFGDVSRISPEAPVPINRVTEMKEVLGGAANVASNLSNLECNVYISGLAGLDNHWDILKNLLTENNINFSGVYSSKNRNTITKMRILGDRQQMLRLDFEKVTPIEDVEEQKILEWLTKLCKTGLDGLVISDYGKGVCTTEFIQKVILLAKQYNIPVIVDPKGNDWKKYNGATYITPNVKELSECIGYSVHNDNNSVVEAAKKILAIFDIDYLVVTRSAKGITLVSKSGEVWHSDATQQEVFDVSGAGDTVVAAFLTAIVGNLGVEDCLGLANDAAGIVVSKVGTYPIHREELFSLYRKQDQTDNQVEWEKYKFNHPIFTKEKMQLVIKQWQDKGETVVFTNGCFDIIHRGHVSYLIQAAGLGDHLIIGLNSDNSVKRLKGDTRPIVSEQDRGFILSALECVDGVVLFEEDTPAELLSLLRPNILVKGGDYNVQDVIGREYVEEVKILPFVEGHSTTNIVEKIVNLTTKKL